MCPKQVQAKTSWATCCALIFVLRTCVIIRELVEKLDANIVLLGWAPPLQTADVALGHPRSKLLFLIHNRLNAREINRNHVISCQLTANSSALSLRNGWLNGVDRLLESSLMETAAQ